VRQRLRNFFLVRSCGIPPDSGVVDAPVMVLGSFQVFATGWSKLGFMLIPSTYGDAMFFSLYLACKRVWEHFARHFLGLSRVDNGFGALAVVAEGGIRFARFSYPLISQVFAFQVRSLQILTVLWLVAVLSGCLGSFGINFSTVL